MRSPNPASSPQRERRTSCTVCGAPEALPTPLPPPVAGTLLCAQHASQLATAAVRVLAEMTANAAGARTLYGRRLHDGETLEAIRAWAVASGYPVSTQGSIAGPLIAAYREAAARQQPDSPG